MDPKPTEVSQATAPPAETKPTKEKKPRSEAQQAATAKALAAMSAKRKELNEERKEKKEKVKLAKKVIEDKIIKEDIGFVMKNDFEARFGSLQKELAEMKAMYSIAQQKEIKEKPTPAPAKPAERIVERVIERVPTPSAPTKLTGYALLDKVFFDK